MEVIGLLAWPAAVTVIVVAIALIFHTPFAGLIGRIRGFKVGQNAIDATGDAPKAAIAQQKETTPPAPEMVPAIHAMPSSSALYGPFEDPIRKDFEPLNLPRDLERAWLCRFIATARVERLHEMNYRLIFGSQIQLMLLARSAAPPDEPRARRLYDAAAADSPNIYSDFTFENWIGFPINAGLLYLHRNGTPAVVKTTPAGEDFLVYLVRNGLTTTKAG
jgi:hypothetical protein